MLSYLSPSKMFAITGATIILILSASGAAMTIMIQSIEGVSLKVSAIGLLSFLVAIWAGRWLTELNMAWKTEVYIKVKQDTNRIFTTWTYDRETWPYVVSEFDRNWNYLRWAYTAMSFLGVAVAVFQSAMPWWKSLLWALGAAALTWAAVLWLQKYKIFKQLRLKEKEVVFHPETLLIGKEVIPLNFLQHSLESVTYEAEQQIIKFVINAHVSYLRNGKHNATKLIQIPLTDASRQAEAERLAAQYRAFYQLK